MKLELHLVIVLLVVTFIACNEKKAAEIKKVEGIALKQDLANHGKYLVAILGCADCHTPKRMTEQGPVNDMDRYLMGFDTSEGLPPIPENVPLGPWVLFKGDLTAAVGPWGSSYAANLTPHETGIGTWSLEQFTKSLREGKFKGLDNTRPVMPPMPRHYGYLTDRDIEAIFSYLKTITPIDNVVPAYQPPSN